MPRLLGASTIQLRVHKEDVDSQNISVEKRAPLTGCPAMTWAGASHRHATPSFFCRLVDEVVYWNSSFLSG